MTRFDRYMLGRFVTAWIAAMAFFSVMYLLIYFFNQIGSLERARGGFAALGYGLAGGLARYYLTNLVFVAVIFVPFTVVLAVMWSGQQVARRGELLAMLAAGVSLRRVALPILAASLTLGLASGVMRESVLPQLAGFRHELDRAFKGKGEAVLSSLPIIEDASGQGVHIARYDVGEGVAERVRIMPAVGDAGEPLDLEQMRWSTAEGWLIPPGTAYEGDLFRLRRLALTPRELEIEIENDSFLFVRVSDIRELLAADPDRADLLLKLHAHYAYPFGCLVLAMLGLPLVLRPSREAPLVAAGAGLMISMAYFVTERLLADLGTRDEILSPALGAWLPVLLFGAPGLLSLETMKT